MGLRGSDCITGVVSGRWVAAGESFGSGRGGRGRIYYGWPLLLSLACFCREPRAGIIQREKKVISC
jgi:hypothetical protein